MTRPKAFITLLALALTALLLPGCRSVVETVIEVDGSGVLRSSVVFSAEEKANFEASAENAGKRICDNLKPETEADTEFVEEVRNGETFCTTVRSFDSLAELRGYYGRMENVDVNQLKMGFGRFVFDVQVDLTPKDGNEPTSSEWRLTIPGAIGDNNADAAEGQTLVWNIEPGAIKTLHAESAMGVEAMTVVLIGAGLLVLGIGIGVLVSRFRR